MLDNAVKDKTCAHFAAAFQIELFFDEVDDAPAGPSEGQPRYLEFDADHGEEETG